MRDIPDSYDVWRAHDLAQSRRLARMPKCFHCGEHVQQDMAVHLRCGWLCSDCIDNNMEEVIENGQ